MSKTITITISKNAVVEAIKGDTSITGNVDRSLDPVKGAGMAYNEQAGNDTYHDKKIDLLIRTAVSKFETEIVDFVESASGSISDTINSSSITIGLVVNDRYHVGIAQPLSGLAQSYIVYMCLFGWWTSIKPELAKGFATLAADALVSVRKCFAKKSPTASSSSYNQINGTVE